MRIAETLNEGLKRAYSVTIPAADVDARISAQVSSVAKRMTMPGFRRGKVPANLVRKMHGPQLRAEALNEAVQDSVSKLLAEHKLRPATQPNIELGAAEEGQDVAFTVALEVLPTIAAPSLDGIKLEKLLVEPTDAEVDEAVGRLAEQQKSFEAAPEGHAAGTGDLVVMDYKGSVDGEVFEGGTGTGMQVELGSGRLIPGFEEQLQGVKAGESRTLNVTFPEDYSVAYLKGKPAQFDVTVTEVRSPKPVVIDDEMAKNFGLEGLDKLKELLKEQITSELSNLSRTHLKRQLLDHLAAAHVFDVPPTMVEAEFAQIWAQLEQEAGQEADADAARANLEKERDDYRNIAERRVRLGLLLSEIGQAANVQVTQAEMNRLIAQEASRFPGQQGQVVKYFQENAMAAAQLRAPLYEEKVVDHILEKAELSERTVTRDVLQAAIEEEEGHVHGPDCGHDHDHDHHHEEKPKAKKAAPKKVEASEGAEDEGAEKPKKPRARKKAEGEEA